MAMKQTYSLLDYMQADKQRPWSLDASRRLLRPLVRASLEPMTAEGWIAVTGAFNVMWMAKDEGLLQDQDAYVESMKAQLVEVFTEKGKWAGVSNSVCTQFAHFLQEVPQATFIMLHRKMVQRTQKNDNTHVGRRTFAAAEER